MVSRFRRTLILVLLSTTPLQAVRITEILYNPSAEQGDLEFVEIYNEEPHALDLLGYHFCAGFEFTFTERLFLDPGEYLVVARNPDAVRSTFGIENVVGPWNAGRLDNGGERILFCDNAGVVRAEIEYNDRGKWHAAADGSGHSLEIRQLYGEPNNPENWAPSTLLGGSPGAPNLNASPPEALLNEIHSLTRPGQERWIELYNPANQQLDLTGFHLSNDPDLLQLTTLPPGTTLPPQGFLALSETQLGISLAPENIGEKILILLSAPGAERVVDARNFRPERRGFSEARLPDGALTFTPAAEPTRAAPNRLPEEYDVVITEIHYHPIDEDVDKEFVEIFNLGDNPVDLSGWAFTRGIRYVFPQIVLGAGEYLVVGRDPKGLSELYRIPQSQVLGPTNDAERDEFRRLSDDGETITLADALGNVVDTVPYRDGGEWPHWADGGGSSLELIDYRQDNRHGQAWDASDDSQKAPVTEISYTGRYTGGSPELHLVLPGRGITLVDDVRIRTRVRTFIPSEVLIEFDDTWRFFKGTEEPPENWADLEFDDSTWNTGQALFGFGEGDEVTALDDMRDGYNVVFFRTTFNVSDAASVKDALLEIEYDDGLIAYLNGVPVVSTNVRGPPEELSVATETWLPVEKFKERFDLDEFVHLLRDGENVLAIRVHNRRISDTDFRFRAQLQTGSNEEELGPDRLTGGTFETSEDLDLWRIQGTHVHSGRLSSEEVLSGNASLKIISTGNGDNKVNRIETVDEAIPTLPRNLDILVSLKARWCVGVPTLLTHGDYISNLQPNYAASHRLEIPERFGTPGEINSVSQRHREAFGSENVGPCVFDVHHAPAVPGNGEPIVVSARAVDTDGTLSVQLSYSFGRPRETGDPNLISIPMTDSDRDGLYTAQIPGQPLGTVIVFYVTATDSTGFSSRFPLDRFGRTHPSVIDPAAPTLNDYNYAMAHVAEPYSGIHQSYRAVIHQGTDDYLRDRPRLANDVVDATFIFGDRDIYYNSTIRFSGSPFLRQGWPGSYRVKMPADRPLHGELKKFGLEDHGRDGRERLSHYLLRFNQSPTTRVPYATQWLVQWNISNRIDAIREHVNPPSRPFLEKWFPNDQEGLLLEMDDRFTINDVGERTEHSDSRVLFPPYGSPSDGNDPEEYRYYFNPRGGNPFDEWSPLIELALTLTPGSVPEARYESVVSSRIDIEEFLRIWSIRLSTDDWDQWGGTRGKNCYLYFPPRHGKWILLAWDMELTYGNPSGFLPPALNPKNEQRIPSSFNEVAHFLNEPSIKRRYYQILQDMVNRQFNSEFLSPYMDKLEETGVEQTDLGRAGGFIDQRRDLILGVLKDGTIESLQLQITTNDGEPMATPSSIVTIEGLAPIDVRTIIVVADGIETSTWSTRVGVTNMFDWVASGELCAGSHRLSFIGLDTDGVEIATAEIIVVVEPPIEIFVRGDVNLNEFVEVADVVSILLHLFAGLQLPCRDAADINDDGQLDLVDALGLLNYLFGSAPSPASPFPEPGEDATQDDKLECSLGSRG